MKLVGERRALASAVMAFYALIYMLLALLGTPELKPALLALGGVYGLAFFALVAGYFWARWYAVGVGIYGLLVAVMGLIQGPEETRGLMMFLGTTHLVATVMLWGTGMSAIYDGQAAWRERFHMDDHAVQRLGRSVIRAGVSLPLVLLYALVPKPDSAASAVASLLALALTGLGIRALIQMKTWGVLALGAAGVVLTSLAGVALTQYQPAALLPALAGALLLTATAPFARPITFWLTGRR